MYQGATWMDRQRHEAHILSRPVVSVGNIAMGGRSKTPFVVEIARGLKERGFEPVVLTRGYGRKNIQPYWLIPARLDLGDIYKSLEPCVEDSGDEALETYVRSDVPVLISADRTKEATEFLKKAPPLRWVFLLDDGFQHWALERDVDIVLTDESDFHSKVFPEGHLREDVRSLERADVVLTLGRDFQKTTVLRAHPPLGAACGVLTTRATNSLGARDYEEFFTEQFEHMKVLRLADHAAASKIQAAIAKTKRQHWILGLKEAVKILNWREIQTFYKTGSVVVEKGPLAQHHFYFADYELKVKQADVLWVKLLEKVKVRELL